ncbi:hypothetical protein B0A50_02196 [Salinomyces thailandicus]|uniref:Ribosomal protein S21 n=1 Tax=Salinomyces thailandicus TaxID=706561 RepID=A0A4U0U7V8_9PEZI|nr:hypothetical protein B0A50_02196 [Salinomyces thailandica]
MVVSASGHTGIALSGAARRHLRDSHSELRRVVFSIGTNTNSRIVPLHLFATTAAAAMEPFLGRMGELAVRAQPCHRFPSPSLLRSRTPTLCPPVAQRTRRNSPRSHAPIRTFSSSLQKSDESNGGGSSRSAYPAPNERRGRGVDNEIASLLDSALDFNPRGSISGRNSRGRPSDSSRSNTPSSRGGPMGEYRPPAGNSADDFLSLLSPQGTASGAGRNRASPQGNNGGLGIRQMLNPNQVSSPALAPSQSRARPPIVPQSAALLPFKLNASVGRTVYTNPTSMDPAKAFRALDIQCARNSVRRDAMRQRYHERPGLKRKRLHSERWRRRFKEGFRGVVGLVQKMRKQGW